MCYLLTDNKFDDDDDDDVRAICWLIVIQIYKDKKNIYIYFFK